MIIIVNHHHNQHLSEMINSSITYVKKKRIPPVYLCVSMSNETYFLCVIDKQNFFFDRLRTAATLIHLFFSTIFFVDIIFGHRKEQAQQGTAHLCSAYS